MNAVAAWAQTRAEGSDVVSPYWRLRASDARAAERIAEVIRGAFVAGQDAKADEIAAALDYTSDDYWPDYEDGVPGLADMIADGDGQRDLDAMRGEWSHVVCRIELAWQLAEIAAEKRLAEWQASRIAAE